MKMKNYDEKIDTLIRNALLENAENYVVSNEVKERINQRFKEEKEKMNSRQPFTQGSGGHEET